MKGQLPVLWFAFGLLITMIIVGLLVASVYRTRYGTCWGDTYTQITNIQTGFNALSNVGDTKTVFVRLDTCVDGLAFINQKEFASLFQQSQLYTSDYVACPEGREAVIIAIPRVEDTPSFFGALTDGDDLKKWAVDFARQKTDSSPKPYCESVPLKTAVFDRRSVNNISLSGGNYCITLKRLEESKYTVLSFEPVESERQCQQSESDKSNVQNAPLGPAHVSSPEPTSVTTPEIEDLPPVTTDVFVDLHTHPDVIRERYPSAVIDEYGRVGQKSLPAIMSLSPEFSVLWNGDKWECKVVMPAKADPEPPIEVFIEASDPFRPNAGFDEADIRTIYLSVTCPKKTINGKETTVCSVDVSAQKGFGSLSIREGSQVRCGVVVDGVRYASKPVKAAKVVYFVLGDYGSFNLLSEFNFFLNRTVLQKGDFKIIDMKGKCADLANSIGEDSCIEPRKIFDCAFPGAMVAGIPKVFGKKDVAIFFIPGDGRAHCHPLRSVIQMYEKTDQTGLAHELGHSYGFGDEYDYKLFVYGKSLNNYPSCCLDAPDNPYKQGLGLGNTGLGSILNGTAHINNCTASDGVCRQQCFGTGTPEFYSNDCSSGLKCCIFSDKLGGNCYPEVRVHKAFYELKGYYNETKENACAGMPLDFLGFPLEELNAPYRSIMGGSLWLIDYRFDKEKLVYPAPKSGVSVSEIWPLRPGAPR